MNVQSCKYIHVHGNTVLYCLTGWYFYQSETGKRVYSLWKESVKIHSVFTDKFNAGHGKQ